ncbi:5'-3' exonuclease [Vibrio phage 1.253.O._10N.286.45.B12]|nr:5'-3' exonuclease [Vibrio phage 1.235.O._10N.261.52.B2]AUR98555.1 5'-3' exonuclease [Vibrio phage 1.253.O._10N.286.45.B12]
MKPLIDADVLRYEVGACGSFINDEGETEHRSFDFVANLFDEKVKEICSLVWATEEPLIFLTVDAATKRQMNKPTKKQVSRLESKLEGEQCAATIAQITHDIDSLKEEMRYKPNFRQEIAKKKEYKATRKSEKPYHYDNLTAYIRSNYDVVCAEGMEADDLLAIHQTTAIREDRTPTTIICTRDKDLRMVEGMHFGWACGKQAAFGPVRVGRDGAIKPIFDREGKVRELKGTGMAFFCVQLITGDTVDNIPGLPRYGPVKALAILEGLTTYEDMLKAVRDAYKSVYGDMWEEEMLEQARLLWMVTELDDDGQPVLFELPDFLFEGENDEQ